MIENNGYLMVLSLIPRLYIPRLFIGLGMRLESCLTVASMDVGIQDDKDAEDK